MKHPTSTPTDLVLLVSESMTVLAAATEEHVRPLIPIPIVVNLDVFARVFAAHWRAGDYARLFVSVATGTPRQLVVLPIARIIDALRAEFGFPVIWIPDVVALTATTRPAPSSPDGDDDCD